MLKIKSKKLIETANISGRGGSEPVIISLFKTRMRRENGSLHDAVLIRGKYKIEFKKQEKDQWFDGGKYYKLTEEEKKIILTFILHKSGKIDKIGLVSLGNFLERLIDNKKYIDCGWTSEILEKLYFLKQTCPKLQAKVKLNVRNFFRDELDIIKVIYERK